MRFLSPVILVGFISLSVFGVLGMLDTGMQEGNTCLASLAQNGACPPPEHTFASASFHAGALKVFSTALLSIVISLASLAILSAGFFSAPFQQILGGADTLGRRVSETVSEFLAVQKIRLALVRFEHSPTSL